MTLSHEMTLTSDQAVVVNKFFYTNIIKKEHAPDAPGSTGGGGLNLQKKIGASPPFSDPGSATVSFEK